LSSIGASLVVLWCRRRMSEHVKELDVDFDQHSIGLPLWSLCSGSRLRDGVPDKYLEGLPACCSGFEVVHRQSHLKVARAR
jgi:hypothetical protein